MRPGGRPPAMCRLSRMKYPISIFCMNRTAPVVTAREERAGPPLRWEILFIWRLQTTRFCGARRRMEFVGTSMPAFAQSAGGTLTDKQIDMIVRGIRERWSKADVLGGVNPPPYSSAEPGDASRGSGVYAQYCASCHGDAGRGGPKASSIVDGSFLALLSDQELRTIVIVGRPELGAPDWRGNIPGKPMSAQEISDVVAWLGSQRSKFPGQPYPNISKAMGEVR